MSFYLILFAIELSNNIVYSEVFNDTSELCRGSPYERSRVRFLGSFICIRNPIYFGPTRSARVAIEISSSSKLPHQKPFAKKIVSQNLPPHTFTNTSKNTTKPTQTCRMLIRETHTCTFLNYILNAQLHIVMGLNFNLTITSLCKCSRNCKDFIRLNTK